MKRFIVCILISLIPMAAIAEEILFELEKSVVTGLVYGRGAPWNSAIVNDKILIEGKTYLIEDGSIGPEIAGERVLARIPVEDRLSVSAISSAGITMTYRDRTVTLPLKKR